MPSGLKERVFNCSYLDDISIQGLFLRGKASGCQKNIANNYVTLKRMFQYSVVQAKVTNVEYSILKDNDMAPLEDTTSDKLYDELLKIIEYNETKDPVKAQIADKIFQIRTKELKYIFANVPSARLGEMKDGYIILDRYLEFIAG